MATPTINDVVTTPPPNSGMTGRSIFGTGGIVDSIVKIMMYVVGILSIIMLIVGGIMYATSAGDEAKVKKAKNTIIAALVGLAFAILAWALTSFVFTALK